MGVLDRVGPSTEMGPGRSDASHRRAPGLPATILGLQGSAGNRAVTGLLVGRDPAAAMLQRQPTATAPAGAPAFLGKQMAAMWMNNVLMPLGRAIVVLGGEDPDPMTALQDATVALDNIKVMLEATPDTDATAPGSSSSRSRCRTPFSRSGSWPASRPSCRRATSLRS